MILRNRFKKTLESHTKYQKSMRENQNSQEIKDHHGEEIQYLEGEEDQRRRNR